ncbi:thioredoxin [Aphelenchoides avenae]|nr:thioredoxin [Aphelenchus avenae]
MLLLDWCGPCKLLGPRLEAKVTSREGQLSLAKVNVDFATDVADDFEITAVPTIIAFKDGQPIGRFEGNLNDEQLDEVIEELLEQSAS